VPVLLVVVPSGWAYWLVRATRTRGLGNPLVGLAVTALVGLVMTMYAGSARTVGVTLLVEIGLLRDEA